MSRRIEVVALVEGRTEEIFIKALLSPYLARKKVNMTPIILTKPGQKGGDVRFSRAKNDIERHLKQQKETWLTLLVDYYGIKSDWPGYQESKRKTQPASKAQVMNEATLKQVNELFGEQNPEQRFIPYVSMFEFEALLFSDTKILAQKLNVQLKDVEKILSKCGEPEKINDKVQTAPSKRLETLSDRFKKTTTGISIAQEIGIDKMRGSCPIFNKWITELENLARRSVATIFMTVVLLVSMDAGASETTTRQGFYFGADIGISLPNDLESTRTNNGVPTNCDQWLEEDTLHDGTMVPLPLEQCSPRALPGRPNRFDLGTGLLAGVNFGYALHNFRLEAEYFRREQSGERLALNVPGDPKQAEFVERSEKISDFRTDNFFANVYYDFHHMLSPKFTPYLGVGLGMMHVQMDYSGTSIRTDNKETLHALGRNRHAAGLASLADEVLADTVFGYQWIAGLDYAWSERFSVGLKLRYGDSFSDFRDGDHAWKPLRGHDSTVGPPGTTGYDLPIRYAIQADNLSFLGISLNLKYYFNM